MMYNSKYYENKVARVRFNVAKTSDVHLVDFDNGKWSLTNDNTSKWTYSGTRGGTIPSTIAKSNWVNLFNSGGPKAAAKDPLNPLMTGLVLVSILGTAIKAGIGISGGIITGSALSVFGTLLSVIYEAYNTWVTEGKFTGSIFEFIIEHADELIPALKELGFGTIVSKFGLAIAAIAAMALAFELASKYSFLNSVVKFWNDFVDKCNEAQHRVDTELDEDGNYKWSGYTVSGHSLTVGNNQTTLSTTEWVDNLTTGERIRGRFFQVNGGNTNLVYTNVELTTGFYTLY